LADIQALDFSSRAELESEIGPEVTPLVGVKTSGQIEPLIFDEIDGSEAIVTEGFLSKFLEAARVGFFNLSMSTPAAAPCPARWCRSPRWS
jgi:hypothetical protein